MVFIPLLLIQPPTLPGTGPLAGIHDPRERHLKNVRQLTFGGQNAEAYWSFDGKRIIFQYMLGNGDADQIFTMNPDGSKKTMISTGKGRCTCAYFLKDGKRVIFASTHGYSEAIPQSQIALMVMSGQSIRTMLSTLQNQTEKT